MKFAYLSKFLNLKGKKLSQREKLIVLATSTIIILATFSILLPRLTVISEALYQQQSKKEELERLTKKRRILTNLSQDQGLVTFNAFYTRASRYLPSTKPSLPALLYLNRLARINSVAISGFSLSPGLVKASSNSEKPNESVLQPQQLADGLDTTLDVSSFDVTFSVEGKRSDVLTFIKNLGEIAPVMKIEGFSSTNPDTNQGVQTDFMNSQLIVRIYYQKLPEIVADATTPLTTLTDQEQGFLQALQDKLTLDEEFTNPIQIQNTEESGKSNPFSKDPQD